MGHDSLPKLSMMKQKRSWWWNKATELCGLDYRSMAIFRIAFGATVMYDIIDRLPDVRAHYSDEGALPRSSVLNHFWNWFAYSFHMASGQTDFMVALFLIHFVFAFGLMVGYKTRVCSIALFVFAYSLFERNPLVLHGGDVLLRLVAFWAMFLPLGKYYSIDSLFASTSRMNTSASPSSAPRKHPHLLSTMFLSFGTLGMATQLILMYVSAHYHKIGKEWTTTRTAAFYALSLDYFRTPLGDFFLKLGVASPPVLHFLTWGVYEWQLWGSMFMFVPFKTQYFRMFAVIGFLAMHAGFGSCLNLGTFTFITLAANLIMIPSLFWDTLFGLLKTPRFTVAVRYPEGEWNELWARCLSFILLWSNNVQPSEISVEGGDTLKPFHSDFRTRWAVKDHTGRVHEGYAAWVALVRASPLLWWTARFWTSPRVERAVNTARTKIDQANEFINTLDPIRAQQLQKKRVFNFHRNQKTFFEKVRKLTSSLALNVFALLCFIICVTWCMGNFNYHGISTPAPLRSFTFFMGLNQHWGMFAPRPPDIDWWYSWEVVTDDGRHLELFRNGGLWTWEASELSFDRPEEFSKPFGNHRWFKIYETFNKNSGNGEVRLQLGRYICREYNARHSGADRVHNLRMWWIYEKHELDGTTKQQPKQLLWDHICYEKPQPRTEPAKAA